MLISIFGSWNYDISAERPNQKSCAWAISGEMRCDRGASSWVFSNGSNHDHATPLCAQVIVGGASHKSGQVQVGDHLSAVLDTKKGSGELNCEFAKTWSRNHLDARAHTHTPAWVKVSLNSL